MNKAKLKKIAKSYFKEVKMLDENIVYPKLETEEIEMVERGDFEEFEKYIKRHSLYAEAEMKLFEIDLKYLEEYIKGHSLYDKAEMKLKKLTAD